MNLRDIYVKYEWRLVELKNGKGWSIVNNDGIVGSSYFPTLRVPGEITEAHNKILFKALEEMKNNK